MTNETKSYGSTNEMKDQKLDKFIEDLSFEAKDKSTLYVLENIIWSMKAMIVDNKEITCETRSNCDQLFRIAIPRIENLISIIDRGLAVK